jgi:putative Holliday junction resolvase
MRVLGVDLGRRRIGIAISDPTGLLARPLTTITVHHASEALDRVSAEVLRLAAEDDGLAEIVVGVPVRLDGSPNDETAYASEFVEGLRARTSVPVTAVDERLTSHEAEGRLAVNERDWRRRKAKLDAAAAAVILQDHLDRAGPR